MHFSQTVLSFYLEHPTSFIIFYCVSSTGRFIFSPYSYRLVFPNGLPNEYSIVATFRLRKTTKKDRWYLWQIFDQSGSSQVSQWDDLSKRLEKNSFFRMAKVHPTLYNSSEVFVQLLQSLHRCLLWWMAPRKWLSSPPWIC